MRHPKDPRLANDMENNWDQWLKVMEDEESLVLEDDEYLGDLVLRRHKAWVKDRDQGGNRRYGRSLPTYPIKLIVFCPVRLPVVARCTWPKLP